MSDTPNKRGLFKPPFPNAEKAADTNTGTTSRQLNLPHGAEQNSVNNSARFTTDPASAFVVQASPRTEVPVYPMRPPPSFIPPMPAMPAMPAMAMASSGPPPSIPIIPSPTMPYAARRRSGRAKLILAMLIFVLVAPSLTTIAEMINLGVMGVHAYSGIRHLLDVKSTFTGSGGHLTNALLNPTNLQRAESDLMAARTEFKQVSDMLNQDVIISDFGSAFPQQITSARALVKIGVDAIDMGQELVKVARIVAPSFKGVSLSPGSNKKPLITPAMLPLFRQTIEYIQPLLNDVEAQSHAVSLEAIPFLSTTLRDQVMQAIVALPAVRADLAQAHDMMDAIGWIMGVGQPRTLLIETMDRAELRPTGGFTGQYGALQINGASVGPFSLQNIGLYEENNPNALSNGQVAPAPFTWWPVGNWGLRDSNLSADFPTSAQLAMDRYKFEFGQQVDGLVLFSPFLIEDVLRATGPISLPQYHETITSQNLEARLHYYQLDNAGIRMEELVEGNQDPAQARKLFTRKLSQLLMQQVLHAPPDVLISIGREMLHALRTKDLQVYVSNPAIENLLAKYGATAQIDRSTTHDGLYVVQTNISANKASQFTRTIMHDTVTLDALGGATHVLQLRLVYNQIGPVYGPDTYHDYVRIYVPPNSQYRWGDGFEQPDQPYCGRGYCSPYDVYGNGDLLCPAGLADSGYRTGTIGDNYFGKPHPLNAVGDPTNMTSDEQDRAMFGGWIVVPKNCTATATLSWYVPPMGNAPYSLLVQRQSSTFAELDLTILPTLDACGTFANAGEHFEGILSGKDVSFSLKAPSVGANKGTSCYVQPGV